MKSMEARGFFVSKFAVETFADSGIVTKFET